MDVLAKIPGREKVLAKWPNAFAWAGKTVWIIYSGKGTVIDRHIIGVGNTQDEAWAIAAETVRRSK